MSSNFFCCSISTIPLTWTILIPLFSVPIQDNGIAIAKYNTSLSPTTVTNGTLTSAVPDTLIKVAPGQKEGFTAFMKSLITQSAHTFALRGTVDGVVHTFPEFFKVVDVGFEAPVTVSVSLLTPQAPRPSPRSST